jgi:ABC-type multidrug transport system ATPase subunit
MHKTTNFSKLQIESILESLGLMETFDDRAIDLSGGEQKRLSIALELIDDPSILFLDEPVNNH